MPRVLRAELHMEPWYKIVQPRSEVSQGRSFNPDEFAIALEQVVAGNAPDDYKDAAKFFARTCFTRALKEHTGMVLRRLAGETANSAPVLTLITQFGGGKTHTLAALYHLIRNPRESSRDAGVEAMLKAEGLAQIPTSKAAVFVGNAWDPTDGRETPWIDVARQLGGEVGVGALGKEARTTPPGTEAIGRVVEKAGGSVLILFDEVLNYLNRYRDKAAGFHAFIQNLTVAMTGTTRSAAVISLPRSQVEMTDWDQEWQDRITKVVRRVAKDLIVNDEAEISEVIRRRLFEDIGKDSVRKTVAKTYADWCFDNRAQLPREWTAVDTSVTEAKARDYLRGRFEACFPFHPGAISVFQRKWAALKHFQQTRGTLAMFAQWISCAFQEGYRQARREPLITLGSAPLEVPEFRAVILGQIGEPRLNYAIEADIAGTFSHARALDADTKGALKDLHRRVGTAILFESSGGQGDKPAHLPELRFALGEPEVDTTSIDNAADALEKRGFYIRKVGNDGYRFGFKPTLKKVVSDRRASLDEDEIKKAARSLVRKEFERDANIPIESFPQDSTAVEDSPRLRIVVVDPEQEWSEDGALRVSIAEWTKVRGKSPRLYPASLVWCLRKPGRELREKVENWLAWQRVQGEINSGALAGDFDRSELEDIRARLRDAESDARDEVWASYRYVVLYDGKEADSVRVIDLGAGHSSAGKSLCGRVLAAMTSQSLLNASVGAGYLERRWPRAFKESGAWPLKSLRQAFLDGSLDRLIDPDQVLRQRIPEFVAGGDFALASGGDPASGYSRVWFKEPLRPDEVAFDPEVYLLTAAKAKALKQRAEMPTEVGESEAATATSEAATSSEQEATIHVAEAGEKLKIRISGATPPEVWNRLGTRLIPKLKSGANLRLGLEITLEVDGHDAQQFVNDLRQTLADLGLSEALKIERG
jgi:Protein of unknown function (DUF499)